MKNKYLILRKDGSAVEVDQYLASVDPSREMKVLIDREAKQIASAQNGEPKYLQYANRLGFSWEKNSGIGFVNYNHKANLILRLVKEYSRNLVNEIGFPIYEVNGSNFFDMQYPVVQAYANLFADRLFKSKQDKKELVMLYDASYPQFNLAGDYQLSYRDLPFAHFSIADCYRYEQSGECMLLFRGRRFNMPDLHPYLKDIPEAFEWYFKIEKQIINAAKEVRREYVNVIKVSSEKNWEQYRSQIAQIAISSNKDMLVEIRRDGVDRYWIIDVDYSIIDNLDQVREIGCIQIDIGNAKRLNISYRDQNDAKQYPVIIHSAVPGGIERYLYMLFDNFHDSFPIWLHPIQLRLLPISDEYIQDCEKFIDNLPNLRVDIDDRSVPIGKKIKLAKDELIPHYFVIGEQERNKKGNYQEILDLYKEIQNISKNKPYNDYSWPKLVSKQIH